MLLYGSRPIVELCGLGASACTLEPQERDDARSQACHEDRFPVVHQGVRRSRDPLRGGVCDPRTTQGLRAPAPKGTHALVTLAGPGTFLSAMVTKQGGSTDLTFVKLEIDGRSVVSFSFAGLRNFGLTENNPFGLQLRGTGGPVEAFTIGWPSPLVFKEKLRLSVTVNEPGVVQILGLVVHGSAG